jgi:hypothetical protein
MTTPTRRLPQASSLAGALLLAGLPITSAVGQLQIAESLLINVDASTFSSGATTWTNTGTLTGNFTAAGSPTFHTINSQPAVFFDDSEQFVGPISPDGIEGGGTSSIEVWAYQGFIRSEESLVSWGRRGDDARNISLNYGTDNRWGAVGHWGGADIGWGPNDPNGSDGGPRPPGTPVEGQWHHLAYTYDGTIQRVYKDGLLVNQESVALNIHPDFSINIGAQRSNAGPAFDIEPGNRLGGAIGKVRVHEGVLSDAQIASNFNLEKTAYGRVDETTYNRVNTQLPALPRNRYTFNGIASGADGTTVPDVIGGKNAQIRGPGVTVTSSGVDLPGGAQTQGYIDLPNGVFSGTANGPAFSSASYEAWVTVQGNNNWSRIMDFGSTGVPANASTGNPGVAPFEVNGPGGAANGANYMFLSANSGNDPGMTIDRGGDGAIPGGGGAVGGGGRTTQNTNLLGTEQHVVMIYDFVDKEWRWYQNGNLMEGFTSVGGPGTVNDVNNWLGRSNWGGDANLDAIFNEFRIYDYALTHEQVQGNFAVGPDVVNVPEPTIAGLLGIGALLGFGRRRRK